VIDLIDGDSTVWEEKPMGILATQGEISAFDHDGFWQPMDTLREKNLLEKLWNDKNAPWKVW
jgi:glucose-1-phosphate cytidylyltransferase